MGPPQSAMRVVTPRSCVGVLIVGACIHGNIPTDYPPRGWPLSAALGPDATRPCTLRAATRGAPCMRPRLPPCHIDSLAKYAKGPTLEAPLRAFVLGNSEPFCTTNTGALRAMQARNAVTTPQPGPRYLLRGVPPSNTFRDYAQQVRRRATGRAAPMPHAHRLSTTLMALVCRIGP